MEHTKELNSSLRTPHGTTLYRPELYTNDIYNTGGFLDKFDRKL